MRSTTLIVLLVLGSLVPAAAAGAACVQSTPSTATFADAPADGDAGLAPEIVGVVAGTDATCHVGVKPVLEDYLLPGDLIEGDAVGVYLDTDGNPATGSPVWDGADRAVLVVGEAGPDLGPAVGVWNGATFDFAGARFVGANGAGGFVATVDELGMAGPATLGIRTATIWEGIYDTYADFAPEPAAPSFTVPVAFSTATPVPSAPPAPPTPPADPPVSGETPAAEKDGACTVPRTKGKRLKTARRKLRRAGCRHRVVRVRSRRARGRVVSTRPAAGRRTARVVKVRVSRGRRARRASAASLSLDAVERRLSAAARVRSASAAASVRHAGTEGSGGR